MGLSEKFRYKGKSQFRRWLIYIFALAAVITVVLVLFLQNNIYQIREQNRIYISNTALQTAGRIDDILNDTRQSVATFAQLYSDTMDSSEPDPDILEDIAKNSMCDYVEYTNNSGFNLTTGFDVSDREYYQKGIAGETGIDVIYHSRLTNNTLVVFYAPLVYKNETVGVLLAGYRDDRMRKILEENYFGENSVSYLCESDGTVIARSSVASDVGNVLDFFTEERVSRRERESFLSALENRTSCVFSTDGTDGETDACLTQMSSKDWCIVQAYPSSVTAERIININRFAAGTVTLLALAFGGYIILISVVERGRRKSLIQENQEIESVVEGVNRLFARLIIVNLEQDSYTYLKDYSNSPSGLEREGSYRKFAAHFQQRIIETEGDTPLQDVLEPEFFRSHMDSDTLSLRYNFCLQRSTGIHWESAAFVCLSRDPNGVPINILFAIQDITVLHGREEAKNRALKDAFNAAQAANRAKDAFLSRMSHDMRTPMNAVLGMASIAAAHADDPGYVRDCLDKIQSSGQHLLILINEILDLSKIESGRIDFHEQPFQVYQSVLQALEYLHAEIKKKKLYVVFPASEIRHTNVVGDEHLFQRILTGVLENAVEYTPENGVISLSMYEEESSGSCVSSYSFVCEDTGIGMSEALLKRVFEPFVCAEDSRVCQGQGIGLGLTIAKQFAQLMGGDILAESTPGKGSRFTIKVQLKVLPEEPDGTDTVDAVPAGPDAGGAPVKQEEDGADAPAPGERNPGSGNPQTKELPGKQETCFEGCRVLLVEDNELNAEIAVELLGMLGVEADIAQNGKIAVDLLLNAEVCPYHLILMDIQMPVMNGYEAAERIRSSGRADLEKLPIIALSANTFRDDIDRSLASGMNAHLAKPVSCQALANVLQTWVGQDKS